MFCVCIQCSVYVFKILSYLDEFLKLPVLWHHFLFKQVNELQVSYHHFPELGKHMK